MPGGIANKSFVREWAGFCAAMDSNDFSKLPGHSALPLMLISKCARIPGQFVLMLMINFKRGLSPVPRPPSSEEVISFYAAMDSTDTFKLLGQIFSCASCSSPSVYFAL